MKTNEQYINEIYKKYEIERRSKKMPKGLKICAMFIGVAVILTSLVYAITYISKNNAKLEPSFTGTLGNANENKVWVGTFNLVWNELADKLGGKIEFEGETVPLAEELNKKSFTKDNLSDNSYYIESGKIDENLKQKIENTLKQKFNKSSQILDKIDWKGSKDDYLLYAMLNKKFTFEVPFPKMSSETFGNSTEEVKYFGLEASTIENTFEQVTALFYNKPNDFAVKIKTKEGEELILYRTDSITSFDESYKILEEKTNAYTGNRKLEREVDRLKIPFIKLNSEINYDELCNKYIKGTNGAYIKQAVQIVDFNLDNYGGNISSEAMINMYMCTGNEKREFNFTDKFVIFLKEENKEKPYFAAFIDNTDVLVSEDANLPKDNQTTDYTVNTTAF